MSDHSTLFEAKSGGLVLAGAILLYRSESPRNPNSYGAVGQDAAAFASIHRIDHDGDGRPTIASGVPLSRAHLRQWTEALGRTLRPEILPDNVLVAPSWRSALGRMAQLGSVAPLSCATVDARIPEGKVSMPTSSS